MPNIRPHSGSVRSGVGRPFQADSDPIRSDAGRPGPPRASKPDPPWTVGPDRRSANRANEPNPARMAVGAAERPARNRANEPITAMMAVNARTRGWQNRANEPRTVEPSPKNRANEPNVVGSRPKSRANEPTFGSPTDAWPALRPKNRTNEPTDAKNTRFARYAQRMGFGYRFEMAREAGMREPCRLGGDITRYRNSLLARSESERSLPDVRHVRSAPSWPVNATISPARRPRGSKHRDALTPASPRRTRTACPARPESLMLLTESRSGCFARRSRDWCRPSTPAPARRAVPSGHPARPCPAPRDRHPQGERAYSDGAYRTTHSCGRPGFDGIDRPECVERHRA